MVPDSMKPSLPKKGMQAMSLQAFLTRLIWLCVLPLVFLAVYLAGNHIHTIQAQRDREATDRVRNVANALDRNLGARIAALQVLAASPLLDDPPRLKEFYKEAQGYRENFSGHVVLADLSMQMLFNTRVPFGAALPKLPQPGGYAAAPAVLATGRPAVGDMFLGPIAKEPLVAVVVPVIRNGQTRALLLSTIETKLFTQQLAEVALPDGWSMKVFDGKDELIAHHSPTDMEISSADAESHGRFVAKLTVAHWSVVLEIPRSTYRAPIIAAVVALATAILCVTLISILAGRLASHRLGRSVATLTEKPLPDAPPPNPIIKEIEEVRTMLDDATAMREVSGKALREKEHLLSDAQRIAHIGSWTYDMTDRIVWSDETYRVYGVSPETFTPNAESFINLIHPDDRPAMQAWINACIAGEKPGELDFRSILPDGTVRFINGRGELKYDAENRPAYMAGTAQDITERNKQEETIRQLNASLERRLIERTAELKELMEAKEAAEAANRAKSEFLANMSHELRTPLNAIIGFSEILHSGMAGEVSDEQKDFIKDILDSGRHLLKLINDILDLSKIEADKIELELSEFDIAAFIRYSLILFKEKAMKSNIKLLDDVENEIGNIIADERKIKQALMNLISNAVKFTPDGGSVRVSARKGIGGQRSGVTGNFIEISVADTGIGIRAEDIPKLFQKFTQLESALTKSYEGTGLGLALTKRLVELHGGKVFVESEPGKGSTFTIYLPADHDKPAL